MSERPLLPSLHNLSAAPAPALLSSSSSSHEAWPPSSGVTLGRRTRLTYSVCCDACSSRQNGSVMYLP